MDNIYVRNYKEAYLAANGEPLPYDVEYVCGWYQFWSHGYKWRAVRCKDLIEWTEVLRRKAQGKECPLCQ